MSCVRLYNEMFLTSKCTRMHLAEPGLTEAAYSAPSQCSWINREGHGGSGENEERESGKEVGVIEKMWKFKPFH